ncbi:hypothetical protein AWB69_02036 [Caballeronia udeis]|uniref:Uncharacterized protein n=1 Tax=Caballeronia udeis TaxID=1232866 RepID=A0A158G4E5_9BURK|nr:hypothetical protein AWB69_02036 [Caballeronia udeis]
MSVQRNEHLTATDPANDDQDDVFTLSGAKMPETDALAHCTFGLRPRPPELMRQRVGYELAGESQTWPRRSNSMRSMREENVSKGISR